MTDADTDAEHIRLLWITFIWRYHKWIIENGMLYIAKPPLFKVTNKKTNEAKYCFSENERDEAINDYGVDIAVTISTKEGESTKVTSDEGTIIIGKLPYGDSFGVSFPNIQGNHERAYEVEPNVEVYDAFIKKLVKYSPILFVEDQNGNSVQDYNVKIVISHSQLVKVTKNGLRVKDLVIQ